MPTREESQLAGAGAHRIGLLPGRTRAQSTRQGSQPCPLGPTWPHRPPSPRKERTGFQVQPSPSCGRLLGRAWEPPGLEPVLTPGREPLTTRVKVRKETQSPARLQAAGRAAAGRAAGAGAARGAESAHLAVGTHPAWLPEAGCPDGCCPGEWGLGDSPVGDPLPSSFHLHLTTGRGSPKSDDGRRPPPLPVPSHTNAWRATFCGTRCP